MNAIFERRLPVPQDLKEMYPLDRATAEHKAERDREVADVFLGKSDKFLLIIGPCSADYEESVMDYVSRLVDVQEKVKDKIIIPRIYTNKPRTTGAGWTREVKATPIIIMKTSTICAGGTRRWGWTIRQ